MDLHRRWYCRECKREWLQPEACYANSAPESITGNPINGSNCIVCGSPEIELVEYKPQYPGLDIPRDQPNKIIPSEVLSVIPGTVTTGNFSIRNEPLLGKEPVTTNVVPLELIEVHNAIENMNEFDIEFRKTEPRESGIYDNSDMD